MKRILIIEDDENGALALGIRLKAHGYATWTACDAIKGLSMALRHRPDLILLDIAIPGGDGFQVADKLKARPETREIPVIFLTASKDPELRRKALDLGMAGLLEKPYRTEELLLMVNYAFDRPTRGSCLQAVTPEPAARQKKVLVVEDDTKIAMALGIRLKAAGYDSLFAHDGLAAVNVAVKNRPDLVLLDVSMPAGNGFTVARRIQKAIPTHTPIIFLTASKRPEFRQQAEELGAVGFFEKPFETDQLLVLINKSLAARSQPLPQAQ